MKVDPSPSGVRAARCIMIVLVAFSIMLCTHHKAGASDTVRNVERDANLRDYIVRALRFYEAKARSAEMVKLRRIETHPYVNQVFIRSAQGVHLEGVAFAYLNLVGNLSSSHRL